MNSTREGTEVYFDLPCNPEKVTFSQRVFKVAKSIPIKPFKGERDRDPALIFSILTSIYEELLKKKAEEAYQLKKRIPKNRMEWAEKVNYNRQLIATFLRMQPRLNLSKVCRQTGCTFAMVKKVHYDLLFQDEPEHFIYNNIKVPQEVVNLEETVEGVDGSYLTITDIKRRHSSFSKKWIRRKLRATGLRYLKMPRKRKVDKSIKPCPKHVFEVVSHISQALRDPLAEIFYIDEMHFPLNQTSDYFWTKPGVSQEMIYNRRPALEEKLSAIAMCSLEKFVAVQVFKRDITSVDFLYFIQTALVKVGQGRRVTILADNASWHTSSTVVNTAAGKALFFNVARLYQANAIETSFSFVRSDFRKRILVDTLEQEAYLVLEAFFREENIGRFKGVKRNHLRSLIKLLHKACPNFNRTDTH